jgi:hypothetical protein
MEWDAGPNRVYCAQGVPMSKEYQTRIRKPRSSGQRSEVSGQIGWSVKKVPNARSQWLDPGEMDFRDFPFRLWKSLK